MTAPSNPPAFPTPQFITDKTRTSGGVHPTYPITSTEGMTLRDWFAGQALAGCATDEGWKPQNLAAWSYEIADAMLAAREAKP